MPCPNCKRGRCFRNWDLDWVCLQCGRAAKLAPPKVDFPEMAVLMQPAPITDDARTEKRQRARRHTLKPVDIAAIRQRLATAPWGTRNAIAQQIAVSYGLSVTYVQQVARDHHRA